MPPGTEQAEIGPLIDSGGDDSNDGDDSKEHAHDDDDSQPVDWVTIARLADPSAVQSAQIRLEMADIPCRLLDENLACAPPDGIKLQVPRDDVVIACALFTTPTKSQIANRQNVMKCPLCGSTDVVEEYLTLPRFILAMLLSLYGFALDPLTGVVMICCAACFIFSGPRRQCARCGRIWPFPASRGFSVESKDQANDTSDAIPIAHEVDHPK